MATSRNGGLRCSARSARRSHYVAMRTEKPLGSAQATVTLRIERTWEAGRHEAAQHVRARLVYPCRFRLGRERRRELACEGPATSRVKGESPAHAGSDAAAMMMCLAPVRSSHTCVGVRATHRTTASQL